eukprot:g32436.t1
MKWFAWAFLGLAHGIVLQLSEQMAPANGAPFLAPAELPQFPEPREDLMAAEYTVNRGVSNVPKILEHGRAHDCDDGEHASKNKCLTHENRKCRLASELLTDSTCLVRPPASLGMWVRLHSHDPRPLVQKETAFCMPCQLDGVDLPCWNSGAWLGGSQVMECEMSCLHQKRVMQPQYSCTDFTGIDPWPDSQTSCFGRGDETSSKCMFITYQDQHGATKSSCAPCELQGVGNIDCPVSGMTGPEVNSTVTMCASQCEAPRPDAHVTLAPSVANRMTTTTPYGQAPEYFPMVVYRSPEDVKATKVHAASTELPWPVELPALKEREMGRRELAFSSGCFCLNFSHPPLLEPRPEPPSISLHLFLFFAMAPPLGTWLPRLLRLAAFTAVAADAACRAARVGRTTLGAAALETLAALPAADVATVRCGELQGTLLHEAVEGGDLEVVKLLLARGGAQTVNAKDRFLKTPLAWAALKGRVEVTKLLLASNATVNAKDEFLATPLSDAAQEGHVEVAKLLLQHGAEMEARGQMGRTPLMEAAEQGHLEVADLLIQEGADLDAVDYAGRPPLVHAAIQGEQDMVELLVENGANVFGSSNDGIAFYKSGPPEIQSYIGQQMRFRSLITQPCFLWILLGAPALGVLQLGDMLCRVPSRRVAFAICFHGALIVRRKGAPRRPVTTRDDPRPGVLWAALQRALRGGLPSSFVEIPSERQMVESELLEDTEDDEQSDAGSDSAGVSLVLLVAARHRSECVWVSSVWAAPICRDQSAMAGGATSTSFYVDSLQLSSLNWYELLLDPSTSWQLEGVTLFGFQLRPFLLTAAFFIFLLLTSLAYMATLLLKCFASMTRPCVTDQGLSPSEAVRLQMLLRAAAPSTFPKDRRAGASTASCCC